MKNPAGIDIIARALKDQRLTINPLDDGSGVVLDVKDEQLLTMNTTGITIVQAIADGARDIEAIATVITARFEIGDEAARQDVREFIDDVAGQLT